MAIELVRIDDRLIHGQVVTTWVKQKEIEQILIINDLIDQDEVQKSVFDIMAPQGVKVKTFGVEKFIEIYKKTTIKRRTLVLLTNPTDALQLQKGGVAFKELNLGGIKFTPEREQFTRAVSLTELERTQLKEIGDAGVDVYVQMIPSDKRTSLTKLLSMEGK